MTEETKNEAVDRIFLSCPGQLPGSAEAQMPIGGPWGRYRSNVWRGSAILSPSSTRKSLVTIVSLVELLESISSCISLKPTSSLKPPTIEGPLAHERFGREPKSVLR